MNNTDKILKDVGFNQEPINWYKREYNYEDNYTSEERKSYAKHLSDKETLTKHLSKFKKDDKGLLLNDTKENAEGYMRVSIDNSDYFVENENEKIRKNKEEQEIEVCTEDSLKLQVLSLFAQRERSEATEALVQHILKHKKIYTTRNDDKEEVWIYNAGIYVPHGKTYVKELVREVLGEAYTIYIFNEVMQKIETVTFIEPEIFFSINNIWEIPVQNGILNLKTRELTKFTPDKVFFSKLGMAYDTDATCPAIDQHFLDVLPTEEDVVVMEEVFGTLLLKDYRVERAIIMLGYGRNGKGKTITLMKNFCGQGSWSAVALKNMREDNFRICDMFGKLVNLSGDLSNTSLQDTGCLKMLIGRDPINADRKHRNTINFVNYAKIVFAANELPRVYDTTDGFWDKWTPFVFPYKFITQEEYDSLTLEEQKNKKIIDPDHINKISTPSELSGLLNKALDGLDRTLKNDNFSHNPSGNEIKSWWIRKSDSFAAFCTDCLVSDYDESIIKKDLQSKFSKYCKGLRLNGVGPKSMKITMENEFGSIEDRKYVDGMTTGTGQSKFINREQVSIWTGVKFIDNIDDYIKNLKENTNKGNKVGFSTLYRDKIYRESVETSLNQLNENNFEFIQDTDKFLLMNGSEIGPFKKGQIVNGSVFIEPIINTLEAENRIKMIGSEIPGVKG